MIRVTSRMCAASVTMWMSMGRPSKVTVPEHLYVPRCNLADMPCIRVGKCGWKPKQKVVTTSALKFPTFAPRGSDGKFKPKDKTTKGKSRDTSARPSRAVGVVENTDINAELNPDYVYVTGLYDLGTFAWPTHAPEGLALALVGTSGTVIPG